MIIVTDRGADLSKEQTEGLDIHYLPLGISLDDKVYSSGVDIQADEFYKILSETHSFPTTSLPSVGECLQVYQDLLKLDPEILSVHISSGLSGTIESARAAAAMLPEAKITFYDTKTLSCPEGWHVEYAARAAKAGWPVEKIIKLLQKISNSVEGIFTLSDLKYLIHGGRISHIKGLVASVLNIKPVISVDPVSGKYVSRSQDITLKRSIKHLVSLVEHRLGEGSRLRVQMLHGENPDGLEILRERLMEVFDCVFLPTLPVAPVLGAHTGPSLVGMAVGLYDDFANLLG